MQESLRQFHPVIGKWFEEKVGVPTPPQVMGWPVIGGGKSVLIVAPTGSGKTLAAFLGGIDWLAKRMMEVEEKGGSLWGVQILYVSPLKALANDVQKNLIKPLQEIAEIAQKKESWAGCPCHGGWPEISVGVRTGDTPAKERAGMLRRPPQILITTPESLNLMITTGARGMLSTVKYLIVDEVHALAGSKRGVFLSLVLERLEYERRTFNHGDAEARRGMKSKGLKIAPGVYVPVEPVGEMVRVGLSATARPEERIARWLAGYDDQGKERAIEVVKTGQRKRLDLGVVCPFGGVDGDVSQEPEFSEVKTEEKVKGVGHWPEVTRAILRMIQEHKSTLVFGNSRQLVERLAARMQEEVEKENAADATDMLSGNAESEGGNGGLYAAKHGTQHGTRTKSDMRPKSDAHILKRAPVILPHHGSIAKEVRLETEQALKRGEVDAVLATSSLELGIDIGALDLVVQIDSPGNVAGALQRVGRAGHLEKATAKGRLVARGLYALPGLAALVPLMFAGVVEETQVPVNCLDVLAQQIVAACVARPWKRGELYRMFRRAMPYQGLSEKQFDLVVGMLSKRAERVTVSGLRPRISFDRVNDELIIMPGVAKVVMVNSGVIADTGQFPVYLAGGKRGKVELGEERSVREARDYSAARGDGSMPSGKDGFHGIRLGELDEEFVYETKEGDRIILGSQTWRVVRIDADRVLVEPAAPGSSRMPFWRGEQAPRSEMLGEAVARFHGEMERRLAGAEGDAVGRVPAASMPSGNVRASREKYSRYAAKHSTHANDEGRMKNDETEVKNEVKEAGEESVVEWLLREHHFDDRAAENAVAYYGRQMAKGAVPTDKRVVVEHFVDRTGEPVIAVLCPLGKRMNYGLRLALEGQFARRRLPAQIVHHDDGLMIRPPSGVGEIPENPLAWLRSGPLEQEIVDQLEGTALFGLRFRQNAARALMLPKMMLSQRTPLWQQRLRARHLLALVKKQRNFPIIVETYRECLQDVLNIPLVAGFVAEMETGRVEVRIVRNQEPSPFARSIYSQFMQTYMYSWDDPLVSKEVEPAVDQHILDEILRKRGPEEADGEKGNAGVKRAWNDVDEEMLRRRIWGMDYPARSAEELLEKIEAAGAAGVGFGMEDERWGEWGVGGVGEAKSWLSELSEKRRILWVETQNVKRETRNKKEQVRDVLHGGGWVGVENLGLLLKALGKNSENMLRGKVGAHKGRVRLYAAEHGTQVGEHGTPGGTRQRVDISELPAALLETQLSEEEARRMVVEQVIKREAVTTVEEVGKELSWMKEAPALVEGMVRNGMVVKIEGGRGEEVVWGEYAEQLRAMALRRQRKGAATVDVAALQRHLVRWQKVRGVKEVEPLTREHAQRGPYPAEHGTRSYPERGTSLGIADAVEDVLDQLMGMGFSLEAWEHEILAVRVDGFEREGLAVLDGICHGGHRVWVGVGEGRIAFWPRHLLSQRTEVMHGELSELARRVEGFLREQGASFLFDMQLAMGMEEEEIALGLRELAFAGLVSNDQLESLRQMLRVAEVAERDLGRESVAPRLHAAHPRHVKRPSKMRRNWWKQGGAGATAGSLGGRWFLLPAAIGPGNALAIAERAADRVERFLRRTGFACRELLEPSVDGGWKDAYDVLTRMEWAGSVRRGYFVDGIAGSQFVSPGVRLDAGAGSGEIVWLSMIDPANVWARAATRWISDSGLAARVPRVAGSWVALLDGRPVVAAVAWGQRLIPLPAPWEEQERALLTVAMLFERLPRGSHPYMAVRYWDQRDVISSPVEELLRRQGFNRDPQGMRLYRQYALKPQN